MTKNSIIEKLQELIVSGDANDQAEEVLKQALNANITPMEIVNSGINKAMDVVGDKFQRLELFLPEMMMSAEVAQKLVGLLEPLMLEGKVEKRTKPIILGTIQGDIHDIGKNIVRTVLVANGVKVIDIGKDAPPRKFLEEAKKNQVDVIAVSILMTTSVAYVDDLFTLLDQENERGNYKIIVGGGCASQEWADSIGADAYGDTAQDAVSIVKSWL